MAADFWIGIPELRIAAMARTDPIRTKYYSALGAANVVTTVLFYLGAGVSLSLLLIDRETHALLYKVLLVLFAVNVLLLFVTGLICRLYLTPRAEAKRREDFFSSAFGVPLTHEQTVGYYNNDFSQPVKRIVAQVLENSFFSKTIALEMAKLERIKVCVYGLLWLICVFNRQTDLGVVVAASQAVFSEELLSKWIRLEWLRARFERTYEGVYRLFQTSPSMRAFSAMTLDALTMYETAKANAAITLSARVFDRLNDQLSAEWGVIKQTLKI